MKKRSGSRPLVRIKDFEPLVLRRREERAKWSRESVGSSVVQRAPGVKRHSERGGGK